MTVPVAPGAPADAPPATPAVAAPPTPAAPAPTSPAATPAAPAAGGDTAATLVQLQADLAKRDADIAKWQAESRKHEDRWKTRDEQLEQQSTLLKTLAEKAGIEVDGAPDPQKLLQQVSTATLSAQNSARELAIFRAANGVANADKLLDSRSFMSQTADLDPAAPDFNDRVKALVAASVAANPAFAAAVPAPVVPSTPEPPPPALPAASGADFSGAPTGARPWTDEDVARATPAQLTKAIADGLLTHMGIAPPKKGRRG